MRQVWACLAIELAAQAPALASVTVSVDLVDPSDGISLPPPGVAVVDVLVDVSGDDTWTAGGLSGFTSNGATLRYATDPNTHAVILADPGTANRFVTFFNKPRARDADDRYTNAGAAAAGRFCGGGATALTSPTEVAVAYFASPPETAGSPSVDGAVFFRVALNIPNGRENFVAVYPLSQVPPGRPTYFVTHGDCGIGEPGMQEATFDVPQYTGFDWAMVDVPEPVGAALLAVGALLAHRRRT